ncbi:ecdysone-induced protein 75B, isoforms C/D isoform X2 [Zeugodacus cucurbitae]|uniref:Ecdysone-induced protein 75B, isoform A n=1 Tax=Zeugodacus cucurbitae TaxID=28588 RepID=A0A0A1WT39_ZEUCU|nr:ecdysone-induced protein 75B, isoforms C/D isoform X2 [Zeugodacus cucurbitae]
MVCATQELNGAERQQQHQRQSIQLQHISETPQARQLKSLAIQPTESQFTKIVLLSTPATNINQNNIAQTSSSRQLKQQHSALVKLLESEPITKKLVTKNTGTSVDGAGRLIKHQIHIKQNDQEFLNLKEKNKQKQQQLIQNVSATQYKRLKTNGINIPLLVEHTTTRNHSVETGTTCSFNINDICETKPNDGIDGNENNSVNKLKCRDLGVDGFDKKCIERLTNTPPHSKLSNPQADVVAFSSSNDFFEQCQCPWKKIRFAREWKQREQLQKGKQTELLSIEGSKQIFPDEKLENDDGNKEDEVTQLNSKGIVTAPEFILSKQTENEITTLLKQQQQFRRDSSDSNSSSLSNSSTQSSTNVNFCTCTPQQLKYQQEHNLGNDESSSFCQFSDNHNTNVECGDELCIVHGTSHHQSLLEQSAMNDLCQKFDDNLETFSNFTTEVDSSSGLNTNLPNSDVKNISHYPGSCKIDSETGISDGFFRRSIQQKIQYRPCTKNQQCSILRINRNRCQYCRLKKCIAVGMSRDAVRFGRVPKREKARILAAMQQSTQNRGQQRALAGELDDQPRLIAAVLRAHLETCEFTKEKVSAMRQRARDCPSYSMPTLLACPLNPAPELQSEQEFSQRFAHVIRGVIDFAGMIPGFQLLTQDDKFTLLKAGLFDALFVRLICMFDSSINSIICLNGQVMRRDAIQNGANARFLVDSTFNFAERMNSMNLSDAEIGLFCAIVLITPDRPGLRNIELIEKMYSRLKGCLQKVINQNRSDQPDFMSKLLDTMPDLRTLSTLHTEKLVVFRTEHKELLRQQMWTMDDEQSTNVKSPVINWDDPRMDVEAKSPLGSVSSTESVDLEYTTTSTKSAPQHRINNMEPQPSALASSTPLLAATLSGPCPLRNRANSGSSGDSTTEIDIMGSHAHLTQNGLTITPIVRSHSHQQLHHHLTSVAPNRYRKLDSPTDSGIESGNEKNDCVIKAVSSGGSSSCSSPRSSVDDALDCTDTTAASTSQVTLSVSPVRSPKLIAPTSTSSLTGLASTPNSLKRQIVEDMPVLKRVLEAPPLYDTNSLMDEAYKPHKKFRALRHREIETAEADPSSTSNNSMSTEKIITPKADANNTVQSSQVVTATNSPPPFIQSTNAASTPFVTSHCTVTTASSPHSHALTGSTLNIHQQSQLHMHLTRQTTLNHSTNSNGNQNHSGNVQQQQQSSLSSTHSVLAKSLMAEPRMTPEQIKRSDIIQNYIMRDQASCSAGSIIPGTPTHTTTRSPAPVQHLSPMNQTSHHYTSIASPSSGNSQTCSSTICSSTSTTTITLTSPPNAINPTVSRWHGHSVITTTSINHRQQSVSPSSNGSSSSSSSLNGCQYFQSPHSTSAAVSPPRPSPSTLHSPPRLLELQVDISDSQQPLNLSKKSPTPPPNKLQTLVAAATAVQKYPTVSADVTVTSAKTESPQTVTTVPANSTQQVQVMLEA